MRIFILAFSLTFTLSAVSTIEFFADKEAGKYIYQGSSRSMKEMDKLLQGIKDATGDDATIYIRHVKDRGSLKNFEPLIRKLQKKGFSSVCVITHESMKDLNRAGKKTYTTPEKLLQQIKKIRK